MTKGDVKASWNSIRDHLRRRNEIVPDVRRRYLSGLLGSLFHLSSQLSSRTPGLREMFLGQHPFQTHATLCSVSDKIKSDVLVFSDKCRSNTVSLMESCLQEGWVKRRRHRRAPRLCSRKELRRLAPLWWHLSSKWDQCRKRSDSVRCKFVWLLCLECIFVSLLVVLVFERKMGLLPVNKSVDTCCPTLIWKSQHFLLICSCSESVRPELQLDKRELTLCSTWLQLRQACMWVLASAASICEKLMHISWKVFFSAIPSDRWDRVSSRTSFACGR